MKSSYTINEKIHCASNSYTSGRSHEIDYIVVHYTGGAGNAYQNAVYFSNGGNGASSAHYFIDGYGVIYKSVWESDTAWHAGNWSMNCRSIGIEVCSDGEPFTQAEIDELHWLVRKIMAEYGIPASRVIRHYDVTGKLCPYPYIDSSKWNKLWKEITSPIEPSKPSYYEMIGWGSNGGKNQKWRMNAQPDGTYEFESVMFPGMVIDACGGLAENGTPIYLWKRNGGANQRWNVEFNIDGGCRIQPSYTDEYSLDMTGALDKDGTKLELWKNNDSDAQRFIFLEGSDGFVQILNNHKDRKLMVDAKLG